jgi:hypothetical protein
MTEDMETAASARVSGAKQVDAAERYNEPGKFSAFVGWEWTVIRAGRIFIASSSPQANCGNRKEISSVHRK